MTSHTYTCTSIRLPYDIFLTTILFLGLSLIGCSRSPWIKADGHEVSPPEHLECAQQVKTNSHGEGLEQEILKQRIEQCMVDKGYRRRPWWLLNDTHVTIREPTF